VPDIKKLPTRQISIEQYFRKKAGKIEVVSEHEKKVHVKPELSEAKKTEIQKGKSRELIEEEATDEYEEIYSIFLKPKLDPLNKRAKEIEDRLLEIDLEHGFDYGDARVLSTIKINPKTPEQKELVKELKGLAKERVRLESREHYFDLQKKLENYNIQKGAYEDGINRAKHEILVQKELLRKDEFDNEKIRELEYKIKDYERQIEILAKYPELTLTRELEILFEKEESKTKIGVLHQKANDLMKSQSILRKDIRIKEKELGTKRSGTKVYDKLINTIKEMQKKDSDISRQINETLSEKDKLLKAKKKPLSNKEELVTRAEELMEKGRGVLYKSTIGILKGEIKAYREGKPDELEKYVAKTEIALERRTKQIEEKWKEKEAFDLRRIKLMIEDKSKSDLEKELSKLEKESAEIRDWWTQERRPDERTQRKAQKFNRIEAIAVEMELLKEAIERFDELKSKTIKGNKTQLGKVLQWSSSKFNPYKKSEAIEYMLEAIEKGEDIEKEFAVGGWSGTSGSQAQMVYKFKIEKGIPYLVSGDETYEIEKQFKKTYVRPDLTIGQKIKIPTLSGVPISVSKVYKTAGNIEIQFAEIKKINPKSVVTEIKYTEDMIPYELKDNKNVRKEGDLYILTRTIPLDSISKYQEFEWLKHNLRDLNEIERQITTTEKEWNRVDNLLMKDPDNDELAVELEDLFDLLNDLHTDKKELEGLD